MKKVFLFNPTNEIAVFNNTVSYTPPAFLRKFEKDVSPLLGFAGGPADLLISDNGPVPEFRVFWNDNGVALPEFIKTKNIEELNIESGIYPFPWGWNKAVHRLFSPLKPFYAAEFRSSPNSEWHDDYRDFYSRETSVAFLNEVRKAAAGHGLISIPYSPVVISDKKELDRWLAEEEPPYVFKTPWSSSGRGLYPVTGDEFVSRCGIWVNSRFRQQKKLIVEPWLDRKQDLSFQFFIHTGGRIEFLGVNYFDAGRVGDFKKEYIGMPAELQKKLESFKLPADWEKEAEEVLTEVLEKSGFHKFYSGPIGIDGMFFENDEGEIKLHPCIEINFRLNMGYVNLKLKDILHPEAKGEWTIRQFRPGEWQRFAREKMAVSPVFHAEGKIRKGFLPLVPVTQEQLYGVWAEV